MDLYDHYFTVEMLFLHTHIQFYMLVPVVSLMKGKLLSVVHIMFCRVRPPMWVDLLLLPSVV